MSIVNTPKKMAVPLLAKFLCDNKNERTAEKLQTSVQSLVRNHLTLPGEKTLVYVGTTESGHGLIYMEFVDQQTGKHILHIVELTKENREGNHPSGASSGDPVYIGTKEVTDEGFTSVSLCSRPFVLTLEQKEKFLLCLLKESKEQQFYNISGDNSIYNISYSGKKYASCISFVIKMLEDCEVVVPEKILWDIVQLPNHLKTKFQMSEPPIFQKQTVGANLEGPIVRIPQENAVTVSIDKKKIETLNVEEILETMITKKHSDDLEKLNGDGDGKDREIAELKEQLRRKDEIIQRLENKAKNV